MKSLTVLVIALYACGTSVLATPIAKPEPKDLGKRRFTYDFPFVRISTTL